MFDRILSAIDLVLPADRVSLLGLRLAHHMKAELALIHVVESSAADHGVLSLGMPQALLHALRPLQIAAVIQAEQKMHESMQRLDALGKDLPRRASAPQADAAPTPGNSAGAGEGAAALSEATDKSAEATSAETTSREGGTEPAPASAASDDPSKPASDAPVEGTDGIRGIRGIVECGHIAEALTGQVAQCQADVLLVGRRGNGTPPEWKLGRVPEQLLSALPCPLWLTTEDSAVLPKRITVVLDPSSDASLQALDWASRLAASVEATLSVITSVLPPLRSPAFTMDAELMSEFVAAHRQVALDQMRALGLPESVPLTVLEGQPAARALEALAADPTDLLVVGAADARALPGGDCSGELLARYAQGGVVLVPAAS